jgi:hypothetical protein
MDNKEVAGRNNKTKIAAFAQLGIGEHRCFHENINI